MKLKNKLLVAAVSFFMLAGVFHLNGKRSEQLNLEPDNIEYDDPAVKNFNEPDMVYQAPKRAATVKPKTFVMHYHNDDGMNSPSATSDGRAFYFWCSGMNGKEYNPDTVSADGKDMTITLDFTQEALKPFAKANGLSYIIKWRARSATDENWNNQSEDIYVDYEEFPPDENGKLEIWTIPGEGNAVETYKTEAETKMERVYTATFIDWKKIRVIASAVPSSYRIYAFTGSYMDLSAEQKVAQRSKYLIRSEGQPTCTNIEYNSKQCKTWNINLNYTLKINVNYVVEVTIYDANLQKDAITQRSVTFENLYNTSRFTTYYNYSGKDLGVTYSKDATTFKVWAPTATWMRLCLYVSGIPSGYVNGEGGYEGPTGSDDYKGFTMAFRPGGIWEVTITGEDLNLNYYNYEIYNSSGMNVVVDPYAKACNINGGRGLVLNFASKNPYSWNDVPEVWDKNGAFDIKSKNELSVYEAHIQDLTGSETWISNRGFKRGTYRAFYESGTEYTEDNVTVKTGFDHIRELGVNAVQLLPIYDHDNEEDPQKNHYNWGYNPKNYNCLEGAYSSNPFDGSERVGEFKNLVYYYATKDPEHPIRIIMDVVYNHVSSAPSSNFNKLMPRYYFRYNADWSYCDGSSCGNEVKSDAPMMSKFIIESLCWWAKEYKIKGFRFDLMALIDSETLRRAAAELYKIDPDIVMYGEGWRGFNNDSLGTFEQSDSWNVYHNCYATEDRVAIGAFNDYGRDAMRGGNDQGWGASTHLPGWGYMQQGDDASWDNMRTVANMLWGVHAKDLNSDMKGANPEQCVNYVSCHDNWSSFDQLYYTLGDSGKNIAPDLKDVFDASLSMNAFIQASNGIAFMQGGDEIFRSKELDAAAREEVSASTYENMYGHYVSHNAYNAPGYVNYFNWANKISITRDGQKVDTTGYTAKWSAAVALHTQMEKVVYSDGWFDNPTYDENMDSICWSGNKVYIEGDESTTYYGGCGFRVGKYQVFLGGRLWSFIDPRGVSGQPMFGHMNAFESTVNLGYLNSKNGGRGTGGAIAVYYKG